MKVSVLLPAYNVDVTLRQCLESIWDSPMCDELIICEGGWNPEYGARSTDKTIEIIEEFSKGKLPTRILNESMQTGFIKMDHEKNLTHITWNHTDPKDYIVKCEAHMNRLNAHNRPDGHPFYYGPALTQQMMARDTMLRYASGDWIFLVDADEIYKHEDLLRLREFLENDKSDTHMYLIKQFVFYFDLWHGREERFRRLFKRREGFFFSDDNSIDTEDFTYDTSKADLSEEICYGYHYGYIGDDRVRKKLEMWNKSKTEYWLKHVWEQDHLGRIYVHNLGGVHLFFPGFKIKKFEAEHPDIMKTHELFDYRRFK